MSAPSIKMPTPEMSAAEMPDAARTVERDDAHMVERETARTIERGGTLSLVPVQCCLCEREDVEPLGVGEDFEYGTSAETFLAVRCRGCGLVYINPRPALEELSRIYPPNYHAFEFNEAQFGFVYKVRRRLEARRVLAWGRGLDTAARIIDVGCGDGFHLGLLRDFGKPTWTLEGVDSSERAAQAAVASGLTVHQGELEELRLPESSYDMALLIQTIEHVADPPALLRSIRQLLKPGGSLVIVTDNTATLDFKIFKGRHWGGYHFPRHWNLFNAETMRALAVKVEMEVASLKTIVSPVNWVYSVRNSLVDLGAPQVLINRFSLKSSGSLAAFTLFDALNQFAGKGALLNAILKRPA
jgi:SAM-dependent methyltransferase